MTTSLSLPLSEEELQQIRDRLAAATPGPWIHRQQFIETESQPHQLIGVTMQRQEQGLAQLPGEHNAHFMAAARSDIPKLLDEIERLRGLLGGRVDGSAQP